MNEQPTRGRLGEVAASFGTLGITSFGGPTAHIGYFREEFVTRRKWLDERAFTDLVALCQLLPGPASSQVGMALGFQRAGFAGMGLAWLFFTAPSALALALFALGVGAGWQGSGALAGLLAAAVGVVAHAVYSMFRGVRLTALTASLMAAALVACVALPSAFTQIAVIALAAAAGFLFARPELPPSDGSRLRDPGAAVAATAGAALVLGVLGALFVIAFHGSWSWPLIRFADYFYAGSLVFGGGHVVLPMLQPLVTGAGGIPTELFLNGYSAAQAVPGPLFTFSAYLGAVEHGWPGAVLATAAMFLPAALLTVVGLHSYSRLAHSVAFRRCLTGINAAVVGILAAAWCTPVFTHGVWLASRPVAAAAIAIGCFAALAFWKRPPWQITVAAALLGWLVL